MSEEFIENRKRMINEMGDADREQLMKDFKMPSMDEIKKLIDSMEGVTEEHKEMLRENIMKRAAFGNPFPDEQTPAENLNMIPAATYFEVITLVIYLIMLTTFIAVFGKLWSNKFLIIISCSVVHIFVSARTIIEALALDLKRVILLP